MGDICRSFLSSCVAFSCAFFESLVFLILSSISASSSLPSSSPISFWIAFFCSGKKNSRWGLPHLPLAAGADALLALQHRNLGLDQAEPLPQPLGDRRGFQDRLPVGNLDGQVRGDRVGELGIVLDLLDDADYLGRHPLVELHVALELGGGRAREGLRFDALTHRVTERDRLGLVILAAIGVLDYFRALSALDQYLDGAVGELEQLQYARKRANLVDRLRCRIFVGRVLLGGEQDEGVGPHHLLEREDRLLASDEEGHDHVRKYDDVAQWQHRIGPGFTWRRRWAWLCSGHGPKSVLLSLSAAIRLCAATTECRWAGEGIRAAAAISAPPGQV